MGSTNFQFQCMTEGKGVEVGLVDGRVAKLTVIPKTSRIVKFLESHAHFSGGCMMDNNGLMPPTGHRNTDLLVFTKLCIETGLLVQQEVRRG